MKRSAEQVYDQHLDHVLRKPRSSNVHSDLIPFSAPTALVRSAHPVPVCVPVPKQAPRPDPAVHAGPLAKKAGPAWKDKLSDNRLAAIAKWARIVEEHSSAFDVVCKAKSEQQRGRYTLESILCDIFAVKTSSALHSRSGPLLRFLKFCRDQNVAPFPLRESLIYDFLKEYCAQQAPTFASNFLGSVAFCHHLLGLHWEGDVFSPRVSGAARGLFLAKRKLVQKPPLQASMVIALENIVAGEGDFSPADRYAKMCATPRTARGGTLKLV